MTPGLRRNGVYGAAMAALTTASTVDEDVTRVRELECEPFELSEAPGRRRVP